MNLAGIIAVLRPRFEVGVMRLPTYRLYRLDGAGKITSADWIEAAGDDQALAEARLRAGDIEYELWQNKRLVKTVRKQV